MIFLPMCFKVHIKNCSAPISFQDLQETEVEMSEAEQKKLLAKEAAPRKGRRVVPQFGIAIGWCKQVQCHQLVFVGDIS